MRIVIEKITPVREGEAVIVSLSLSDEAHEEKCKHEIATDLFLDMGFPLSSGDGIEISQDGYEEIIDAAELTSAIKKGADFIGFAQNTAGCGRRNRRGQLGRCLLAGAGRHHLL